MYRFSDLLLYFSATRARLEGIHALPAACRVDVGLVDSAGPCFAEFFDSLLFLRLHVRDARVGIERDQHESRGIGVLHSIAVEASRPDSGLS